MGRICGGLALLGNCFCVNAATASENIDDVDSAPPKSESFTEVTGPASSEKVNNEPKSSMAAESNQNLECLSKEVINLDWVSGARKEITVINWKIKDFLGLLELPDLLRTESCTFTAGSGLNFATRWRFNVQRMKNDSHIGLFLERLKPLSFKETILASTSRGIISDKASNNALAVVPVNQNQGEPPEATAEDDGEIVYVHYECLIKKSGHGPPWVHKRTVVPDFKIGKRLGFRKLFTLPDFREAIDHRPDPKYPLLSEDNTLNLEIKFSLLLPTDQTHSASEEARLMESVSPENSEHYHAELLCKELGCLLKNGNNTDLILIMEMGESDKTFSVHRSVLSARSPVFAAMFQSGMKECYSGIVRIKDITPKAMETVLCYIYSGIPHIELDWKNVSEVQDVIYAADKYSLSGLKNLCDKMMFCGCELDNAMELLYLAQTHGLEVAVRDISVFIKRNVNDIFNLKAAGTPV